MKPMLAGTVKSIYDINYPVLVSPKIDGIRCIMAEGGKAVTRSLKPVPNEHIRTTVEMIGDLRLDGELEAYERDLPIKLGRMSFTATTSAVMSHGGRPMFHYIVFDCWLNPEEPFAERHNRMQYIAQQLRPHTPFLSPLAHEFVEDVEQLSDAEERAVAAGYEGLMVRSPTATYKFGRSTWTEGGLLKLKRIMASEGIVIGFGELMRNENDPKINALGLQERSGEKDGLVAAGTLGFLILHTQWGELKVGSGFSESDRETLWAVKDRLGGMIVTFKHSPTTKDKPRFPIWKGFRAPDDMDIDLLEHLRSGGVMS